MSALGQERIFAAQNAMSALPPKADMCGATRDVRFVPIADIREFGSHQKKKPRELPRGFCCLWVALVEAIVDAELHGGDGLLDVNP